MKSKTRRRLLSCFLRKQNRFMPVPCKRYWLTPPPDDPTELAEQICTVCEVYEATPTLAGAGTHVMSTDEMTGIQALERLHPTLPIQPGHVERQEFEYKRGFWGEKCRDPLFAARQQPSSRLTSSGLPAHGSSVADKGFAGERPRRQWLHQHLVDLVTPPHQSSKRMRWPKALRRWLASMRQIIETVNDKLLNTFRLARERSHDLTGFQARLAAKVGLHNFCLWLNLHLGRAPLAFADLIDW